jgi:hypothetical protein
MERIRKMETPLGKSRPASRRKQTHVETLAASAPRLALIKKRVQSGYYDSGPVLQEIVEAMMASMGRRARM